MASSKQTYSFKYLKMSYTANISGFIPKCFTKPNDDQTMKKHLNPH